MMQGKIPVLGARTFAFRERYEGSGMTFALRSIAAVCAYHDSLLVRLHGSAEWDVSVDCASASEAADLAGEIARRMGGEAP